MVPCTVQLAQGLDVHALRPTARPQPFASDVSNAVAVEVVAAAVAATSAELDSQARLQPKAAEGSLDRPCSRK